MRLDEMPRELLKQIIDEAFEISISGQVSRKAARRFQCHLLDVGLVCKAFYWPVQTLLVQDIFLTERVDPRGKVAWMANALLNLFICRPQLIAHARHLHYCVRAFGLENGSAAILQAEGSLGAVLTFLRLPGLRLSTLSIDTTAWNVSAGLSDSFLARVGAMTDLKRLRWWYKALSVPVERLVAATPPSVIQVDVAGHKLSTEGPATPSLPRVTNLVLRHCTFRPSDVRLHSVLQSLPALVELHLEECSLRRVPLDEVLMPVKKTLKFLRLRVKKKTQDQPSDFVGGLQDFTALVGFRLAHGVIDPNILRSLPRNLRELRIPDMRADASAAVTPASQLQQCMSHLKRLKKVHIYDWKGGEAEAGIEALCKKRGIAFGWSLPG